MCEHVSTLEKVKFLSCPATYPETVDNVDVKETHMSWLFLAGDLVYKLKKPVKYAFLDFSTLRARQANCLEEVRLNRRLAHDVYHGVLAITLAAQGQLVLGGKGKVIDWLVVMRRLPEEKMLDKAIMGGAVTRSDIGKVSEVLARFYKSLAPAKLSPEEYVDQFAREQEQNRAILTSKTFKLPKSTLDIVLSEVDEIISDQSDLLMDRVHSGSVIDGHGDLRPEHICLSETPVIIDCLEFNQKLRLVDPFDELAFLGMECEQLGASWIGDLLISRHADLIGEKPPKRLLTFYTAYRACLRGRLALAHLLEHDARNADKWRPLARDYLSIAERAILEARPRATPPTIDPDGYVG